jgi:hypothetical protein
VRIFGTKLALFSEKRASFSVFAVIPYVLGCAPHEKPQVKKIENGTERTYEENAFDGLVRRIVLASDAGLRRFL